MTQFIEGLDRLQTMLLPEHLDDYVDENGLVRAIDAFADILDLAALGFNMQPAATGRPGYHPGLMLRIYFYGYFTHGPNPTLVPSAANGSIEPILWKNNVLLLQKVWF
ncbi:hypothetical protein PEL8287_03958 [Roseovarius litorisediminis]|uniref:Transposase InsH N-terminal domain-containing protein n=1 Tax=Roseovarius litorisediminis TaxID=1312363 RepID=A0A1Y5TYH3_9RHOB|nr:hypothetical protein PEL8287_03958 [Roseovarius litorisediminis]